MDKGKQIKKPKVSVIIPVYNTGEYVEEAVRSIMNQTLSEIEIIILDDGSTDHSSSIIKKLALEDHRIIFYLQENQGPSRTRNKGISIASGDYIHFLDSDDLLASETFELCYEACVNNDLDFVFFDANSFSEEGVFSSVFDYHRTYLFEAKNVYSGNEMLETMLEKKVYRASACLNFIKREFIIQSQLTFYPDIIHEDELFTSQLYLYAQRVSCIQRTFYLRRFRKGSIMTTKFAHKNIEGYLTIMGELKSLSLKNEKFKTVIDKLIIYILNPAIYNSRELSMNLRMKVLLYCIQHKYMYYIKLKNVIVLMFPFLIGIKSVIRKENH